MERCVRYGISDYSIISGVRQRRPFWSRVRRRETEAVFLPEAHTDFVLALIGEELGFFGTGVIILLFVLFMIRGFQISTRARIPFGRYLGIGITTLIGVQALTNACVVTGLVPTKGSRYRLSVMEDPLLSSAWLEWECC